MPTIYLKTNSWLSSSERARRVGFGRQTFPSHFSSFHEGSPASSSKLSRKPQLAGFSSASTYLPLTLKPSCSYPPSRGPRIVKNNTEQNVSFLHSIVIPLLSPLPLSIIHTGWWRRGLETTTTLTPVAPSSLCDVKKPHIIINSCI